MGPLARVRVIEMGGIGPAPFCGMLLADMGAEVIRIDRLMPSGLGIETPVKYDLLNRNKKSIALNLKTAEAVSATRRMIAQADVLIEGFRPGVMEKLGLGPDLCLADNPKLVYGRVTGWGQYGPLAHAAGHDLNYIALTGALAAIGTAGAEPVAPLNLVGDFGGGAMYLATGILAALVQARSSGHGQVVDAAIVDGTASLMTMFQALHQAGDWSLARGCNIIDGGAPFYTVYETSDGKHVSVGAIETKFYEELIERIGLANEALPEQHDRKRWPELRARFADIFRSKTRDEWCRLLEGTDACFAPVLDLAEAQSHAHMTARHIHVRVEGVVNSAPAPRFSRTPSQIAHPAVAPGSNSEDVLAGFGFSPAEINALKGAGASN
jgi:alpha-methylacyl-CoA racemase